MPADMQYGWRIKQGERETLTFPIVDADGIEVGVDGWEVEAKIRTRPGGPVLYTFPSEHAVIDPDDDNTVRLTIPSSVSELWVWSAGWFIVVISDPDSDPDDPATYRVLSGPVVVDKD